MSLEARPEFRKALHDFRWLLERGYPERSSIRLVGDRYRLSRSERAVLYRGVCSRARAEQRRARLIDAERAADSLIVDGYNVLFTVLHFIQGKTLFLALDGFVRDTGSGSGRIGRWELFEQAADRLVALLSRSAAAEIEVYLDHRMTRSRDHIAALREAASECGLRAAWRLVDSADQVIRERATGRAALVSADSELIDKTDVGVVDAGGEIVRGQYGGEVLELATLLQE